MGVEGGEPGWMLNNLTGEQYVAELNAYSEELKKDNYVLGGTVFISGGYDMWRNFETDDLVDMIITHYSNGEEEPPVEVKNYVYVWLDTSTTDEWTRAIFEGPECLERKKMEVAFATHLKATGKVQQPSETYREWLERYGWVFKDITSDDYLNLFSDVARIKETFAKIGDICEPFRRE